MTNSGIVALKGSWDHVCFILFVMWMTFVFLYRVRLG